MMEDVQQRKLGLNLISYYGSQTEVSKKLEIELKGERVN